MTEPRIAGLRPSAMQLSATLALATVTLLASGCGQAKPSLGGEASSDAPAADSIGTCAATDPVIAKAPVVVRADVDGDGAAEDVRMTLLDATHCPNYLFTKIGSHLVGVNLHHASFTGQDLRAVSIPSRQGQLVVARATHPRGGFQTHLYAYADKKLAEVTAPGGDLPIPFVATDTTGGYVSASCTSNGFVVRQAVVHEPPGIVFAWDIRETAYQLDGTTAKPSGTKEIKDNVLDKFLREDYGALVRREMFTTGCGS